MGTIERSWDLMIRLLDATEGMAVAVGLPIQFEGVLINAMALLANGKLVGLAAKENLATGDVEYENRYFLSWPHGRLVEFRGPDGTIAPCSGLRMFQRWSRAWARSPSRSARTPGRGSGPARPMPSPAPRSS